MVLNLNILKQKELFFELLHKTKILKSVQCILIKNLIFQGLICPMCMKRYSTVENLQLCNAKCLSLINQSTYENPDPPVDPSIEELKEENKIQG